MTSRSSTKSSLWEAHQWALSLPIPDRHLRVLIALISFMHEDSRKAWPSLKRLTERAGTLEEDTVHYTMAELIECGILSRVSHDAFGKPKKNVFRIEVGESLPNDSNPLMSILLQDVARRMDDVTAMERLVLLAMARCYDWTLQVSIIDYKRAQMEYPWLTTAQWRSVTDRLAKRAIVKNMKRGNRYSRPHYTLPGLTSYIHQNDASREHSYSKMMQLQSESSYSKMMQLEPYIQQNDVSRTPYIHQSDVTRNALVMNARAELPKNLVVVDSNTNTAATTYFGSSEKFETALPAQVLPRRGEDYVPELHGRETHRLNALAQAAREWSRTTGQDIHPSQAERLRDVIEAADWIEERWGHVGEATRTFRQWADSENLSRPYIRPEASEGSSRGSDRHYELVDPYSYEKEASLAWAQALERIRGNVTGPNFETWLKSTIGMTMTQDTFVIGVPSAFAAEHIEQRMYSLISRTLESVLCLEIEIEFVVYSDDRREADSSGPEMA